MTNISPEAISELERVIDQKIQNALVPRQSSYDATVVDVEGDTVWVDIPGVSKLLPAEKSYVSPNPGDLVSVTFHKENGLAVVDGNISNPGIGIYSTIDGSNLLKGSVGNSAFKLGSIAGTVLEDGTITGMKIADSTITNANIADSTITGGKIIGSTLKDIPYASIVDADIEVARIADARIRVAVIDKAQIRDLEAEFANIQTLIAQKATIVDLTAANARIDNLVANYASIEYLEANYIDAGTIDAEYIRTDMMNANVGWIQNGTIANAAIVNEMVHSVSANKLTAGTIDASKINVANLRADNLIVRRINGQPVVGGYTLVSSTSPGYSSKNPNALGWYEMVNGEFVLSQDTEVDDSKAYYQEGDEVALYDQTYIDGIESDLNARIDGTIETFSGADIPTLTNYPYNTWYDTSVTPVKDVRAEHVGDLYYVIDPTSQSNGYCYRFAYDNTTHSYNWVLIKDSDVTRALSDISDLQTFESNTVSWIDETDEGLRTIRQNHTTLSGRVDKTVVETVQLWFTKVDTTAPGKPTAHVTTNNASTPNAWNIAVPTYNSSYPNYYYCYEWKYADGTYGWSSVTRDIAMGESQSLSRTGVATANANIKSSVMLWFTKANDTAPSKPTSQVTTNNAATGNAWNIAVPTYNSAYPHYFYCYQQQKGDGTYQWTDVVYDRATSETQSTARATSSSLANYITTNNAAIDALQDQIDGAVDIWYGSSDPTSSTAPWPSTDSKDIHVGDLYYNTSNGHSFRYTKSGSTYSWTQIPDSDASAALAAAQDAQATADGKRRIFTTTPTVPYDIGDLWVNGSTVKYATVKKTGSQSYAASDWSLTATDDTMAKVNIKSSVMLWFTKANTTAPAKPTSVVTTNNASTPNAWNIAVPTYNSSYKNYFYCYQQQKGDGTYQWTDVVFDSATTETMAKSQAALPATTFTTFQQTTFKELVDEVDEQSSTITQMSEQIDKAQTVRTQEGSLGNRTIVTDDAADLPLLTLDPVYGESVQDGTPTPDAPFTIHSVRNPNRHRANWTIGESHQTGTVVCTLLEDGGYKGSRAYKRECTVACSGWFYTYSSPTSELRDTVAAMSPGEKLTIIWKQKGDSSLLLASSYGFMDGNATNGMTSYQPMETLGTTEDGWTICRVKLTRNSTTKSSQTIYFKTSSGVIPVGAVAYICDLQVIFGESSCIDYIESGNDIGFVSIASTGERNIRYLDMTDPSTGEPVELYGLDDTYRDILRIDSSGHAMVEKRCQKVYLDGSVSLPGIGYGGSSTTLPAFWYSHGLWINTLGLKSLPFKGVNNPRPLCDRMVCGNGNYRDNTAASFDMWGDLSATLIISGDSTCTTAAAATTWLQNNPLTFVCPIAESDWYTIDLGYVELPTVTDDATVYVAAEVQPVIGGSWWTQAGYEMGKTVSTTVNSVKQTAESNSAHLSNLTSHLGLNADGTGTTTDIVSKYNQIDQDLDGLTTRVGKTESKTSLRYTFVRDNWTEANWATKTVGSAFSITPSNYSSTGAATATGFDSTSVIVGDLLMIQGTSTDSSNKNWHSLTCKVTSVPSSSSADIPTTIVAVDDTTALASRVTQAETSISQNATAITLRATKTELTSAIDGIEIGGRNLLKLTPISHNASAYGAYVLQLTENLVEGEQYTIQFWDVDVSHSGKTASTLGVHVYWGGGYNGEIRFIGTDYFNNGHADYLSGTFTATVINATEAQNLWLEIYNSVPNASGNKSLTIGKWKLEKGNKATDWTPATEDMATSAELKVANDAISTKVEKNGVISSINQSSESITINANRVNIEGASLFSSSGALAPSKVVIGTQQQWYSSTSRTALSGGSWATTQPSLTEGHYLWLRTLVTYASGATTYLPSSTGICISEKSDVSIVGRNLLKGTATLSGDSAAGGGIEYSTDSMFGGVKTVKTQSSWTGIYMKLANIANSLITGERYTASVYVKSDEDRDVPFSAHRFTHSSNIGDGSLGTHSLKAGVWEKLSITFTATEGSDSSKTTTSARIESSQAVPLWWAAPKLEKGAVATDWIPASEDAIGETSRIYYRTNVANFGTAPTAWVTKTDFVAGTDENTWTRKRMPYDSTYNLIYTCEQRKSVTGAFLGCTEVLLDDTTTVIDGGHITTGTIDANRIAAGSLAIGKLTTAAQNTITNAAKTASNYITADTNGIKIYNSSSASSYLYMTNSIFEIYNNDTSNPVISVNNTPSVRIGKSTSFNQYIDSSGVTYYNNGLILGTLKAYNTSSSITRDIGIKITTGKAANKSYSYLDMTGAEFESSTTDVATIMAQSRNTNYYAQMWTKAITYQSQVTIEASNVPTSSDLKRAGYIDLASSKTNGYDTFARIGYKDLNNSVDAALEIGKDCNHMWIHNPSVTDGSTQVLMGIKLSMAYIAFGTVANAHAYTANGVYFHKANGAPSWYQALTPSNSAIYVRNGANSNWNPILTFQTSGGGTWSIGNYNNEALTVSYVSSGATSNTNTVQSWIESSGRIHPASQYFIGQQFYAEAMTNITTANIDTYFDGASLTLYKGTYVVWGAWAFNTGTSSGVKRNTHIRIMVGSTEGAAQRILAADTNWSKQSICTVLQISGTSAVVKVQGSSSIVPQSVSTGYTNWIRAIYIGPPNA